MPKKLPFSHTTHCSSSRGQMTNLNSHIPRLGYIYAFLGSLVANVSLSDAFLLLLLSPYFSNRRPVAWLVQGQSMEHGLTCNKTVHVPRTCSTSTEGLQENKNRGLYPELFTCTSARLAGNHQARYGLRSTGRARTSSMLVLLQPAVSFPQQCCFSLNGLPDRGAECYQ